MREIHCALKRGLAQQGRFGRIWSVAVDERPGNEAGNEAGSQAGSKAGNDAGSQAGSEGSTMQHRILLLPTPKGRDPGSG